MNPSEVAVAALAEIGHQARAYGDDGIQLTSAAAVTPVEAWKSLALGMQSAGLLFQPFDEWLDLEWNSFPANRAWFRRHGWDGPGSLWLGDRP